jgi:phosphatidate cytidylyltransferase|tara:strand:+ start:2794 stop:3444 length:651 start_codon:yes stop_codon:yes gene_type:complete
MISKNLKKRIYTSLALLLLTFLIFNSYMVLTYSLILLSVLSILEFLSISQKVIKNKFFIFIVNFFFIFYIFIFSYIFLFFSNILQLKMVLFSILIGCVASDIGGFVSGKFFQGPKLTKISPNKTYSGSLGSIIFTTIFLSYSIFYFTENFDFKIVIISIITSLACQIGDLFFSFLKRKAKLKDTGNFLPGHGGILDRVDGILLGMPAGFLTLIFFF